MKAYSGHRSWNAWNVALWLHNDPDYYADWYWMSEHYALNTALKRLMSELPKHTPDGAVFNRLSVKLAIQDEFEVTA
mgnify:FL=1|tara:strand:+ start:163 stop:393 length:231 start_codon:yes stop_codon:yes gene_type:complete